MAEVNVTRQSTGQATRTGEQRQQREGLTRWGEPFRWPSPREFFSMNPFALMRRISEDMDRMFGSLSPWRDWETGERTWAPDIEVCEREGNMVVCADLPGLSKDDLKVEVTDEGLVIQGERKREREEKREGFYRSERSYGRFHRTIPLPEGANVEQARAEFNNGVLEISIPIPEQQRKRREIRVEESSGQKTRAGGGA